MLAISHKRFFVSLDELFIRSNMLIEVGHPHLYFVKISMSESIASNASISLKNPLLVGVWPMCLRVICRLIFIQYKITWLVGIRLCRLVGIRLNRQGLVLTSEWIVSTKPYWLCRVFIIHLVNFAKPTWCSNCSKFVRSHVHIQVYLIVRFVQQGFIGRFGRDPRRLQLLFLSQGFLNWALVPLGGHGAILWGPRAEAEQGPRAEAKTRYFYWWAGGHKYWESLEGGHPHERLRITVLSDTDKSC